MCKNSRAKPPLYILDMQIVNPSHLQNGKVCVGLNPSQHAQFYTCPVITASVKIRLGRLSFSEWRFDVLPKIMDHDAPLIMAGKARSLKTLVCSQCFFCSCHISLPHYQQGDGLSWETSLNVLHYQHISIRHWLSTTDKYKHVVKPVSESHSNAHFITSQNIRDGGT